MVKKLFQETGILEAKVLKKMRAGYEEEMVTIFGYYPGFCKKKQ